MVCKKDVRGNFAKFAGKHLCQNLIFNKILGLVTLFKKRIWHGCFPVNFAKFLRTPFPTENLRWLLLIIVRHILEQKFDIIFFINFVLFVNGFIKLAYHGFYKLYTLKLHYVSKEVE